MKKLLKNWPEGGNQLISYKTNSPCFQILAYFLFKGVPIINYSCNSITYNTVLSTHCVRTYCRSLFKSRGLFLILKTCQRLILPFSYSENVSRHGSKGLLNCLFKDVLIFADGLNYSLEILLGLQVQASVCPTQETG